MNFIEKKEIIYWNLRIGDQRYNFMPRPPALSAWKDGAHEGTAISVHPAFALATDYLQDRACGLRMRSAIGSHGCSSGRDAGSPTGTPLAHS